MHQQVLPLTVRVSPLPPPLSLPASRPSPSHSPFSLLSRAHTSIKLIIMSDQPQVRKYQDKEAFVTGHSGSTIHEILLLCLAVPIGLHLYYCLLPFIDTKQKTIALEFAVIILPMLVMQTRLLDAAGHVTLLLGMLLLASAFPTHRSRLQSASKSTNNESKRPTYLSTHRSSVYLLTTIAILAVDFPIFPRKYCKTETCGYGWMDLGAASFVIIAGWSSSLSTTCASNHLILRKAIKKCAPLFLLGMIRLATNKGLEYQEHVSEYGVHWNFFFTLCFMEGFLVLWRRVKPSFSNGMPLDGILAVATLITYQMYLTAGGQDFIENGARRCSTDLTEPWTICDIFYANREGILGLIGYVSLRLLSEEIGRFCLASVSTHRRLLLINVTLWMTQYIFTFGFRIPTSRRSTNLTFALWALAHNITILSLIKYVTRIICSKNDHNHSPMIPWISDAVNRNGLAVFLISNILTGLVNLTVDTLHSSDAKAFFILSAYLGVVCGCTMLLDAVLNREKSN